MSILIYLLFLVIFVTFTVSIIYLIWFLLNQLVEKAKTDMNTRNNILSCIYFLMDMGPSISSVAAVAIVIMPQGVTIVQLTVVFIFGIMMKKIGRRLKESFYKNLGYGDER